MTEYPPAQHYYSRLMAAVGRIDDSLAAAQAAWEMDREDQVLNSRLAIAHLWKNEMEQAQQFYDIANAMDFDAPVHLLSYALFLIIDGRIDESREALRRALTLYRSDTSWTSRGCTGVCRSKCDFAARAGGFLDPGGAG
jgi:tetratricopeptide (TPR) repeat protein